MSLTPESTGKSRRIKTAVGIGAALLAVSVVSTCAHNESEDTDNRASKSYEDDYTVPEAEQKTPAADDRDDEPSDTSAERDRHRGTGGDSYAPQRDPDEGSDNFALPAPESEATGEGEKAAPREPTDASSDKARSSDDEPNAENRGMDVGDDGDESPPAPKPTPGDDGDKDEPGTGDDDGDADTPGDDESPDDPDAPGTPDDPDDPGTPDDPDDPDEPGTPTDPPEDPGDDGDGDGEDPGAYNPVDVGDLVDYVNTKRPLPDSFQPPFHPDGPDAELYEEFGDDETIVAYDPNGTPVGVWDEMSVADRIKLMKSYPGSDYISLYGVNTGEGMDKGVDLTITQYRLRPPKATDDKATVDAGATVRFKADDLVDNDRALDGEIADIDTNGVEGLSWDPNTGEVTFDSTGYKPGDEVTFTYDVRHTTDPSKNRSGQHDTSTGSVTIVVGEDGKNELNGKAIDDQDTINPDDEPTDTAETGNDQDESANDESDKSAEDDQADDDLASADTDTSAPADLTKPDSIPDEVDHDKQDEDGDKPAPKKVETQPAKAPAEPKPAPKKVETQPAKAPAAEPAPAPKKVETQPAEAPAAPSPEPAPKKVETQPAPAPKPAPEPAPAPKKVETQPAEAPAAPSPEPAPKKVETQPAEAPASTSAPAEDSAPAGDGE